MVNVIKTEKEIEEAKAKKEEEELKVQIEVYEGQSYEARQAYEKAQEKYTATRRKLPKDVPTDKEYARQDLEAQYIQMRVVSPKEEQQVKEYRAEIKRQREVAKSVQVLDKQLPQLYSSAVEEVEAVKTGAEKAKQKVEEKYDSLIQTKTTALETEKARRAKQIADVEEAYQERVSQDPNLGVKFPNPRSNIGSGFKKKYQRAKESQIYQARALESKQEAMKDIRFEHLTADGFQFASAGTGQSDFGEAVGWYKKGFGRNYVKISAKGQHQFNLWLAREDLLYGKISQQEYHKKVGISTASKKAYDKQQDEMRSAQARAQVAGYLKDDSAHWANVASNPYTSNPNYKTPSFTVGSGTKDDPFRTDYNKGKTAIGETTTPPKEMVASYLRSYQEQATKYNKAKTGLETTTFKETSTGKDVTSQSLQQIQKQREAELANRRQQQYVAELREGNIGKADALMNPQTTQSYTGTSTVNLKTFLKERGYDLNKPEAIPDSVLTTPVKYTEARKQASDSEKFDTPMGDLRFKEPYATGDFGIKGGAIDVRYRYPEASAETQLLRRQAKERIAKFDPKPMDSLVKDSSYVGETGTITLKKNEVLTKKQSDKWGFDPIANITNKEYQTTWTVTVKQKGVEYTADFKTREEAVAFKKSQEPKVFSGTDNEWWNKFMYASAVDSGEVISPKETPTLTDDVRYYSSVVWRPLINLGASAVNLTQPADKQIPTYQTGAERLIGGTIDDTLQGQPLKGTGVTGTWKYIQEDPLRATLELPAEAVMWVGGGKAISLGVQGVKRVGSAVTTTIVQSPRTPQPVVTAIKTTQKGVEKAQVKMQQYNPLIRYQTKQVEKIGSSVYPREVPRRIEKFGSTYVITAGTESYPMAVPAITVKFGRTGFGGKTTYYTDSPSLGVAGSKGLVVVGDLPKTITGSKVDKYLYEVPVKGDRVKMIDPMGTGKDYQVPVQSLIRQDVGQEVGYRVTEKTRIAQKADEPPFRRIYTKETIIETPTTPKPKTEKIKEPKTTVLKDLFGSKTGTGKKSDIVELPSSKTGQVLDSPTAQASNKSEKLKGLARGEAKASVKTSPYRSAIVGSATKASATVGTKALASTKVDTGVKIQQDVSTGLLQETAVKTQQELKTPQRLKQTARMKIDTGLKLDTGSKLMTQQKTALSYSTPVRTESRSQRPKALPFVLPKVEETETRGKRKRGKKAGFIGNVRLDSIVGMYKRKEITYGQKKVRKLERLDMKLTTKTPDRITQPSSKLLKSKKKKKPKTETDPLGNVSLKSKSEFAGFKEKKTKKKTKRRRKSKSITTRLI